MRSSCKVMSCGEPITFNLVAGLVAVFAGIAVATTA